MDSFPPSSPLSDRELLQIGYRYALALARHPEDAEDLVQEAWLKLSRHYGGVESRAVLFTAIRHLFIDHSRRKKVIAFESLDQAEVPVLPALAGEEPGLKGDMEKLLAVLRPAEREAMFLHYYEGRTAEEIGQLTGQPRGTVLSLLHRAIARLREAAGKAGCNQWLPLFVVWL